MKRAKRIYCIEGHWNYGKREVEPSVEPMLQLLRVMGQWDYARRDCATVEEMYYFLDYEWVRCRKGSILYFATHGDSGEIHLSDEHLLGLDTLSEKMNCKGCLIHFGGCEVLSAEESRIRSFLERTGASAVSGYTKDVGWSDVNFPPALALELILFSSIAEKGIILEDGRSAKSGLGDLAKDLKKKFRECGFKLYTKWD